MITGPDCAAARHRAIACGGGRQRRPEDTPVGERAAERRRRRAYAPRIRLVRLQHVRGNRPRSFAGSADRDRLDDSSDRASSPPRTSRRHTTASRRRIETVRRILKHELRRQVRDADRRPRRHGCGADAFSCVPSAFDCRRLWQSAASVSTPVRFRPRNRRLRAQSPAQTVHATNFLNSIEELPQKFFDSGRASGDALRCEA